MADGTIGSAAVAGATYYRDATTHLTIVAGSGATISGELYKLDIYLEKSGGTQKIKIFRDDGTNYLYVGGVSLTGLSAGLNSNVVVSPAIKVKIGDYIGFYDNSSVGVGGVRVSNSASSIMNKAGDITTDSVKTDWAAANYKASILGYIKPIPKGGVAIGSPMIF